MAAEVDGGTGTHPADADADIDATIESESDSGHVPDDKPDRERRGDRLAVAIGAVAGAMLVGVLAGPRLGADPLWLDEAYSLGVTNQFAYGVKRSGGTMFLYYCLLWAWSQVSESPAWLRLLSTMLAMAVMVPLAAIGRVVGGRRVAVAAPLLLAGAYMFQAAALEARAYTFEILAVSICWLLLIGAVTAGVDTPQSKRWWVALTLIAPWGVFIHGLFVLFLAAMVLAALLSPKPRACVTQMLPLLGATGVMLGLLTWLGVANVGDWVQGTRFRYVKFTMYQYLGGYVWVRAVSVAALVGLIAWVVADRRRLGHVPSTSDASPDTDAQVAADAPGGTGAQEKALEDVEQARLDNWLTTVPLVWFLAPPILLLLISIIRPEFVDRYFVAVAPAAALTVAVAVCRAIDWLTPRVNLNARTSAAAAAAVCLVLVVGWSAAGQENLDNRTVSHWDDIATMVADHARPGDGLLLYGDLSRPPFEAAWSRVPHDVVPELANVSRQLGEVKRFDFYYPGDANAHRKLLDYDRIWAVNVGRSELPAAFYELKGPLPHDFHLADSWNFADRRAPIIVRLYVRNGTDTGNG
ncbi:MAG TPA: glycosyltransferase family 39 protein [Acidimicrobiales bacterium]|nr:glycosyltransferase family 39 protein [Acidimicrobiales bacterium]